MKYPSPYSIFLILEGFIKEKEKSINMVKKDYCNFNGNEFQGAIHNLDWESLVDIKLKDPNLSINNFNSVTC